MKPSPNDDRIFFSFPHPFEDIREIPATVYTLHPFAELTLSSVVSNAGSR